MDGDNAALRRVPLRDNLTGQGLILTTLALMAAGVVMVFSATRAGQSSADWFYRPVARQAVFAAVGSVILLLGWMVPYRWLAWRPWPGSRLLRHFPLPAGLLLAAALVAAGLLLVPGVGHHVSGAVRWYRFFGVGFQPSEILKFALLIFLAALLAGSRPRRARETWRAFLACAAVVGAASAVVVTENFGTAAVIGLSACVLMLMGEVAWYYVLGLVPAAAVGFYRFVVLVPYRWARIAAYRDLFNTANPSTFQGRQALIAIATGSQPAGIGGGMASHGYLPKPATDFIFAIVCEQLGLPGAAALAGLFLLWLALAARAATRAPDRLGALLAGGLGFVVCLQAALHLAVNLNWLPPTGISLPFVSYGGSALVMMSAATAIIVSVTARRAGEDGGIPEPVAATGAGAEG